MRRSHLALLLVLGAPVALYAAVIAPRTIPTRTDEPTSPAAYFPTAVGTKWVYRVTLQLHGRDSRYEAEEVVTDATDQPGEQLATLRSSDPFRVSRLRQLAVSETKVRSRSLPERSKMPYPPDEPSPWHDMFPHGISSGVCWTEEWPGDRSRTTCTIIGWETVHVPAGAYHALRTNYTITDLDTAGKKLGTLTGAAWFAPGVGLVKYQLVADFARYKLVHELMSFSTPPGQ